MAAQDVVAEAQERMKKLPDLERVLSKYVFDFSQFRRLFLTKSACLKINVWFSEFSYSRNLEYIIHYYCYALNFQISHSGVCDKK